MKPTEIKQALAQLGGGANKRLGQHFLIDDAALATIAKEAHVHPAQVTLEIGPGLGVLTRALLESGHVIIAIERDRRFVEYLQQEYGANTNVRLIQGDAAELSWEEIVGDAEWQLVSNLPYAISSLALRKALWAGRPAENVVVLVQREVGERALDVAGKGKNGKTSLLSLMVALASSSARIVRHVPPGAFFPPPKVDSVVLQIEPMPWPERMDRWGIDPEKIMEIAKRGFAHPRKLLASNLGLMPNERRLLVDVGISEKARAEDVLPKQWADLARVMSKN